MHFARVASLVIAAPAVVSAFSTGAPLSRSLSSRPTSAVCLRGPSVRNYSKRASCLTLRAQEGEKEMTEAEQKEYEALLEEARRIQGTFKQMIGGAFGDEEEPEPEPEHEPQSEAPKGFNIPIEEYDDDETLELETEAWEPVDLEAMSPEEREAYEKGMCQNQGDEAFEACEAAIKEADWDLAWQMHETCLENYSKSGILEEGSIFRASFMDSLNEQERKLPPKKK